MNLTPERPDSKGPGAQNETWQRHELHRQPAGCLGASASSGDPGPNLRGREDVALGPVDADGNLGTGGAELLEEPAVCANPQVLLRDFHLERAAALSGAGRTQPDHGVPARPPRHSRRTGSQSLAWCRGPAAAW